MKRIIAVSLILGVMLATIGLVVADNKANQRVMNLPANAIEVAPGVFYLGKAIDKGRIVEGYAMFVKPETECGNGICEPGENIIKCPVDCGGGEDPEEPDTSSCYDFLAKGAKWRTVEPYIVDPTNTRGLDESFVRDNLALDIDKWETAAAEVSILGEKVEGIVDGADLESPDNKNEVYFADVDYENAIAIAIVWGIFGGPPFARELVEWDMVFDDVDFDWSDSGEAGKMDFESIATHELGHAVGLDDLYKDLCSEQTMYGYAGYGETEKRTLESGDIAGIRALY